MLEMKRRTNYIKQLAWLAVAALALGGCKKEDAYTVPTAKDVLQNDVIKRTLGPHLVGLNIEFAYAMAILPSKGKLVSAEVKASIAGASATYLENRSFYTNSSGTDVGIEVGSASVNKDNITTVTFTRDTSAATLRYFYRVPEDARGKTVTFTFTAKSSNGETVTSQMGPYTVATMDLKRLLPVTDGDSAYISIADMAVYNAADAALNASKIDLVYLYRSYTTSAFNHALVAPAADVQYLPGVTLPAGVNRSAKLRKVFNLQDFHLAQLQYGIYIDDRDFQELNFTDAPNFAINLKAEAGVWVETADGKYRAYVYFNSATNATKRAVVSIKRYAL